jgi:hypothetical protein
VKGSFSGFLAKLQGITFWSGSREGIGSAMLSSYSATLIIFCGSPGFGADCPIRVGASLGGAGSVLRVAILRGLALVAMFIYAGVEPFTPADF